MKKILFLLLSLNWISSISQTLDFGVEVQQNNNMVQKWLLADELSEFNRAFSIRDINGDTLNVYFNNFSMTNNFDLPLYFRLNLKPRYFADLKISNTTHTLIMEGVSNFNDGYFTSNYGTYSDFEAQANANGFTDVDTSDYTNYINGAKAQFQSRVRSIEEFKVLSFTSNIGFRLLPHRSFKPYITLGFTAKFKYSKFSYQNLEFARPTIYDYSKVNQGVNKFSEATYYVNAGLGMEFYRFRAGLYYQAGLSFQETNGTTNDVVIDINPFTPFERIHSFGFTLCANLFSTPLTKRVVYEDLSTEELPVSNIQRKSYKWEFEARFNRRLFNDINTYYDTPETRLSVLSRDSILYNNGSQIVSGEKVEMLTFGDVKRIFWSGQYDIAVQRNFGRRFSLEAAIGFSSLTTDIETRELTATVLHDTSNGNSYVYNNSEPRIRSGVYRNTFGLTNFCLTSKFKLIDRDLFSLTVYAGTGNTAMFHRSLEFVALPAGVNDMQLYQIIDNNYYSLGDNNLYVYQGSIDPDLNASPDDLFAKFGGTKLDSNWQTPEKQRVRFPMVKFGISVTIDRYTLGLAADRSRSYMDGFLLDTYSSIYFSVGYKFRRR